MSSRIKISQPGESKRLAANDVKYLIIHYTAGDYERAKHIFEHPDEFDQVSVQFVLDTDGTVDELIPTLSGTTYQANHCGVSYWIHDEVLFSGLNKFSIGIEIINPNGNLLAYTEEQYLALCKLIKQLMELYPHLKSPYSILGHEQIAGFRGKVDPGRYFNWRRIYMECYGVEFFNRGATVDVPPVLLKLFASYLVYEPSKTDKKANVDFWRLISSTMEASMSLLANEQPLELIERACHLQLAKLK